jgi:hypothetical protein
MSDDAPESGLSPEPGQQPHVRHLSIPEARDWAELISVGNDLERVKSFLYEVLRKPPKPINEALWSSALIAYRRSFNRKGKNGLTDADVLALSRDALEFHKYLRHQADKLIAHSVNAFEQVKIGVLIDGEDIVEGVHLHAMLVGFQEYHVRQWLLLVDEIIKKALAPKRTAAYRNFLEAAKTVPKSQLMRSPKLEYRPPKPDEVGKPRA